VARSSIFLIKVVINSRLRGDKKVCQVLKIFNMKATCWGLREILTLLALSVLYIISQMPHIIALRVKYQNSVV